MSGQVTDALGRPGEGVHAHRTCGFATVDVVGTVVLAAVAAHAWCRGCVPFAAAFAVALPATVALGIAAHVLFRVPTALNCALGLATPPQIFDPVWG